MPVFRYKGFNSQGKSVSGLKDADNERALRLNLRRDGILLTEVKLNEGQAPSTVAGGASSSKSSFVDDWIRRIKSMGDANTQTIAVLTRQLATLLKASVQLSESLNALIEQTERPGLKQVLSDVRTQVNEGRSFSHALARHPQIFSELYVNMVAVGEASGNLDVILFRLADFLDSQNKLKSKVTSALFYPAVMMLMGGGVMILLMTTVVPKIVDIFKDSQKALPWNTELLIFGSDLLLNYFWIVIPVVFMIVYGFLRWKKSVAGRKIWDRFILKVWIIGPLVRMIAMSRFAGTSATMLSAGLPLLKALEIVEDVLGNRVLTQVVANARESIREGESIAQPLKRSGEFPSLLCHMIAVGEKSGQLETMLENVASAYNQEVETKIARLTSLLEPLMIAVMGAMVGFVVISVLTPIQQLTDVAE